MAQIKPSNLSQVIWIFVGTLSFYSWSASASWHWFCARFCARFKLVTQARKKPMKVTELDKGILLSLLWHCSLWSIGKGHSSCVLHWPLAMFLATTGIATHMKQSSLREWAAATGSNTCVSFKAILHIIPEFYSVQLTQNSGFGPTTHHTRIVLLSYILTLVWNVIDW